MRSALPPIVAGLVLLVGASSAVAQRVEISADTRQIYAGLPFALLVEASGFDEDPEPAAPELAITGCSVLYVGASPRVVRSTSVVNGRRTDRVEITFVYRYQVTPSKAGSYKIPVVSVEQGSKKARSKQRTFAAKSVAKTDKMALRVVLPKRAVWLGETFEVAIDWYLGVDPSRPSFGIPIFAESDWFSVKPAEEATRRRQTITFSAGKTDLELPYSQERAELDGQPFTRLRFRTLVTPLKSGTLELPPARVVAALEVGVGRDRFGFPASKTEIFEAMDSPRTIEVKALPQSGRPAGFGNAVGTGFSIDVAASRTVVRVGDPIELTVTVKSGSRLAGMALPDLNVLLEPNHFAVGDDEPVGKLSDDGKTKVFQVTAQLKSSDVREVPPLVLAYFNPKTASYEAARSQPIALQVAGSAMVGAAQVTRPGADRSSADPKNVSLVGANLALSRQGRSGASRTRDVGDLFPLLLGLYLVPCLLLAFMVWRLRTEGQRAATGVRKKRVGAFDKAIASAAKAPGKDSAADIAAALRSMMKKRPGEPPDGFDRLIADLDAEAYDPRGGAVPLDSALLDRCKKIGGSLLAGLAVLLSLSLGIRTADAAGLDEARDAYQQAVGMDDQEQARQLFARAAADFAAAVAERPDDAELLVDWGNASLGAREFGWAALAYRRALHLDRGNQRARSNLVWVRGSLPKWAAQPTNSSALSSLFFWHSDWSLARRHLIAGFAFAFAILLLVPWRHRPKTWAIVVSSISFCVVVAMLISVLLEPDRSHDAVVVRDAETLRAADSPGAASVLERPLPAGIEVKIVESRDRWRQVELPNGQRGWLPQSAIKPVVRR